MDIDPAWTHEIVRKSILLTSAKMARRREQNPDLVRDELLGALRNILGDEYVAQHFTPSYTPWRQRICFVPNGDFFEAIKVGKASVVTDEIERLTPKGIRLKSGGTLEADIIITATGFDLSVLGGIDFSIDNQPLDFSQTVTYRGMMFTGVPNLVWVFGYFRASWTLRADLIGDFVPRLLRHMDEKGAKRVEPVLPPGEADMELGPWVDPENFNPGLPDAQHASDAAERDQARVAPHAGLLVGKGRVSRNRPRGAGVPLPIGLGATPIGSFPTSSLVAPKAPAVRDSH